MLDDNPATLLQMYEAGALDLLHLHLLPVPEMDRARQRYAADYLSGPQLLTNYMWFNNITSSPFKDVRVRHPLLLKPRVKGYQLSTMKGQFWKDVIIEPHESHY